jgi:CDGSH-type Zn-finger protein
MSDVKITVFAGGPYVVKGAIELVDGDGNVWDTAGKKSVALCRCAQSQNLPFCDGTHSSCGFEGACSAS